MDNIIDILREQYNTTINQQKNWDFLLGLAGYINYTTETPILSEITAKAIKEKTIEYEKLAKLEKSTLKELGQSKIKLLKIIEKNNISPDSLSLQQSIAPNSSSNLIESLEAFEKGGIRRSGFRSDNLHDYLFDIATSILRQGYQLQLKDFLVSDEEYGNYRSQPDSYIFIINNINGNFIFSPTLKLRREQSIFIEKTKKYKIWGDFDKLLKFQEAFLEKSENKSLGSISQKNSKGTRNSLEMSDAIDIVFFAQDLEALAESKGGYSKNSHQLLNKDDLYGSLSRVHSYFLKELTRTKSKEEIEHPKENIIIDLQRGIYNSSYPSRIYEISGKRLKIVQYIGKNNTSTLSDLISCTGQVNNLIVKEIKEVNKNFKQRLKIKKDLIIHSKTGGGYRLNKNELDIKTST